MQLVKDFTAERACTKVKFYMGMVMEEQQTFEGLVQHLKKCFSVQQDHQQTDQQFLWSDPKEERIRRSICR